jgi:phosphoadenosine phosphosulfate reductase
MADPATDEARDHTAIDVQAVNARLEHRSPQEILAWATETFAPDVVLTCSFQHDGVALAHMLSGVAPRVPVVFLETGFHFPETLAYRDEIVARFGLNQRDPDLCCRIHKVEPLRAALDGMRCWINGRRRDQMATRRSIGVVERYEGGIYKVNPLANWTAADTYRHMREHSIPEHPLFDKGYASIGCAPCTRPILAGEDERAGRWSGIGKTECGIHTFLKPAKGKAS